MSIKTLSLPTSFSLRGESNAASKSLSFAIPKSALFYKLLIVFLLLSAGPLILAGYRFHLSEELMQKESRAVKLGIAQKISGNVASYMENLRHILQVVHKSNDFLGMNPGRQSDMLGNVMNAYPMLMRMTVLDMNGREISSVNRMGGESAVDKSKIEMEALQSIRSLGDYMSAVSRSPEGYPQITLGVPIETVPGRPIGVLMAAVNLLDLSSLIKDLVVGKTGYIYIVDMQTHQLVAYPDLQVLINPPARLSEIDAALKSPEDQTSGVTEFKDDQGHVFLNAFSTVPLSKVNWRIFVQQPVEEAYLASIELRQQIFRSLLVVTILTILLAVVVTRVIVRRVHQLKSAMELVGEGNFDIPPVPVSHDEFGELTEQFLSMAQNLKDKTVNLLSAQKELQHWNVQLESRVQHRTRALQDAQDQLIAQEKLAALGQMASVVGHELRNPLAVMNNSVYFLKTKLMAANAAPLDPKLEKHLNIIEGEIVKSNTIIRDILDFARSRPLNAQPHALDTLVEKAIERIQIPPNVTVEKYLLLQGQQVVVDEDEVRQVLTNLMENACQAMVSGGVLRVETRHMGELVEVSIGDSGCGIPAEHLAKIFAPFFTTKSRGTGLGLAVVKKIIDRHCGTIDVRSKVGEGTTFIIRFPVHGVPPTAVAKA